MTTIAWDGRFISDRFHGIGRHAYQTLEAASRLRPDIRYVVFGAEKHTNTRFDMAALDRRSNVKLVPFAFPLYQPLEQAVWPWVLARAHVSIFHSPYITAPIFTRGAVGITVHDLILEKFPEYAPGPASRLAYTIMTRVAIRRAAVILTDSNATRRDIVAYYGVDPAKVHVTYSGVSATFRPVTDPRERARVREAYQLPERFVLTLGAGRPHKNVRIAVEALAHLNDVRGLHLVVAGAADTRFPDELGERASALGVEQRLHRTGPVRESDLASLYSMAEAFVFPSLVEGFGLPPIEAMACGVPVIAAAASVMPEVLGNGAFFFDPRSPRDLGDALRRVLFDDELRADLLRNGEARVRVFSWENVAKATLRAYGL